MTTAEPTQKELNRELLALFLPEHTLEYFDCKSATKDAQEMHIVLEEKNHPPLQTKHQGKKVQSKGFWKITVHDFPIRGRKVFLHFRRRIWKVAGEQELLKRDIQLTAPGTQLEQAFALFLKAGSRREAASASGDC